MIEPFVSVAWWREHSGEVVLADVRWYLDGRSGREEYEKGHLPGAVFVDLDAWLADSPSPERGRHPLPSPERVARGMASCGIGSDATVIAYDDAGGVIAARLVWMLRALGHNAALLDGGLRAYVGPLESGASSPQPANFELRPWPHNRLADIADATDGANVVIDARPRERYQGAHDEIDPRAGHIPSARSVPCREHLGTDGLLLQKDVLRGVFESAGVRNDATVISYCGSGVTACHNLLAIEYVGLGIGRLFPGSWSQYSAATHLPVETGNGSL